MFKGYPDPFPGDGPIPFFDEFEYMERYHQGFADAYATPRRVRAYLKLYASVKDAELAERRAAAERGGR